MHSYRDLPLRWAELGTVYRYEKSGVLHGLLRVRGFTQDDAHLYLPARPDARRDPRRAQVLPFHAQIVRFRKIQGLPRDPAEGKIGRRRDEMERCDRGARSGGRRPKGFDCEVDEGGGAFYGPKIDIKIKDALNREWQCSTIQFDFNDVGTVRPDLHRAEQREAASVHDPPGAARLPRTFHGRADRALCRRVPALARARAGQSAPDFGTNSSTMAAKSKSSCALPASGPKLDDRNEKIGYKIRDAEVKKIPYMAVVGEKEQEAGFRFASAATARETRGPWR